jgi:Na+/H+-translocating membrane pyrophosphatase
MFGKSGGKRLPDGTRNPVYGAAVIGDTVGDPWKDTCGPALNILIKLMAMVSVVFTPVVVKFAPVVQEWMGIVTITVK